MQHNFIEANTAANENATGAAASELAALVRATVDEVQIYDIHTHLYAPDFKDLLLWGVDDLLTYHYLIAEAFRYLELPYERFWAMSQTEQADLIWDALFLEHSPLSESCRESAVLNKLGLDTRHRDLPAIRRWFDAWDADAYIDHCMELAGVRQLCMTNSPFDELERPVWENGFAGDSRFSSGLRIDPLLLEWEQTVPLLARAGYEVSVDLGARTMAEIRRFLETWTRRMDALYIMISLPPDFAYPGTPATNDITTRLLDEAILPHCREHNLPFALMPGVIRQVNPQLRLAGDGVGRTDLSAVTNLCAAYPTNKFLITALARENQHELAVLARKFRNLHVFGCWWFMNNPVLIDETTRMRMELLGTSFTPQHSDARVLDQIIYKWDHSRRLIADVLVDKYSDLAATGWQPSPDEIERDVYHLFGGAFENFLDLQIEAS